MSIFGFGLLVKLCVRGLRVYGFGFMGSWVHGFMGSGSKVLRFRLLRFRVEAFGA